MMFTYLILNIVFIGVVLLAMKVLQVPFVKRWYLPLIPLLVLTAVFDPLIIHFDIVGYDDAKLLGLKWLGAPIEDFMYSILAVILVPSLWNYLHNERTAK